MIMMVFGLVPSGSDTLMTSSRGPIKKVGSTLSLLTKSKSLKTSLETPLDGRYWFGSGFGKHSVSKAHLSVGQVSLVVKDEQSGKVGGRSWHSFNAASNKHRSAGQVVADVKVMHAGGMG